MAIQLHPAIDKNAHSHQPHITTKPPASLPATMENGSISQGEGKDPSSFLSEIIGNPVTVKLNSGVVYKGKSTSIQPHSPLSRLQSLTISQESFSPSMAT